MCAEWRENFMLFYNHVGPRPSAAHTLDRKNVNGNYEPGNVRWATIKQQANNTRSNSLHEWKGVVMTLAEIADLEQVTYRALWSRMNRRGQTLEYAIASMKDQTNKARCTRRRVLSSYRWKGKTMTLREIASTEGVGYKPLWARLNMRGQSLDHAVASMNTPENKRLSEIQQRLLAKKKAR